MLAIYVGVAKTKFYTNSYIWLLCFVLVNTKVDLRFHVLSAEWIPGDVRYKILERVQLLSFATYSGLLLKYLFQFVVELQTKHSTLMYVQCKASYLNNATILAYLVSVYISEFFLMLVQETKSWMT